MGRRVARKRSYFLAPHLPAPTTFKRQRACPAAAARGVTSAGKSRGSAPADRAARRPGRAPTIRGLLCEAEKPRATKSSAGPTSPAQKWSHPLLARRRGAAEEAPRLSSSSITRRILWTAGASTRKLEPEGKRNRTNAATRRTPSRSDPCGRRRKL